MTTPIRHTGSCTANVLCAARLIRHACAALQAPRAHPSPASQHIRRHAGGDTSRTSSSAEPAWQPLGAQQLSMKLSVARRLSSSPATRLRPMRSAQAIWADAARKYTCCHHVLGRVAERDLQKPTLMYRSCSLTFDFLARKYMVRRRFASSVEPCTCGTQRTDGRDERGT